MGWSGRNTATYKFALTQALSRFVNQDKTIVTFKYLARWFFELYEERVDKGMPQLNFRGRQKVMERIVQEYRVEKLNKNEAIDKVHDRHH